jgi:limonene-1,2-epoxide hydrolase
MAALALAAAGCGEDSDDPDTPEPNDQAAAPPEDVPGDADPEDKRVIGAWVDALRRGDVEEAASYFAIPSVAENGPLLVRIRSEADAVAFNESLPCGAELVEAEGQGDFTTATFELTERPGAGRCGSGVGETASTAFVIRDGEIVEWRRVDIEVPADPGQAA